MRFEPVLVCDGQSFVNQPAGGRPYALRIQDALARRIAPCVVGVGGTTYAERATTVASRTYPLFRNSQTAVLIDCGGQSGLLASMSAADLLAAAESYMSGCRTAGADYIIGCTVTPGTDPPWYTSAQNTQRLAYNDLLRASSAFDAIADLAALPHAANPADTTYFSDGLHPTQALVDEFATAIVAKLATIGIT